MAAKPDQPKTDYRRAIRLALIPAIATIVAAFIGLCGVDDEPCTPQSSHEDLLGKLEQLTSSADERERSMSDLKKAYDAEDEFLPRFRQRTDEALRQHEAMRGMFREQLEALPSRRERSTQQQQEALTFLRSISATRENEKEAQKNLEERSDKHEQNRLEIEKLARHQKNDLVRIDLLREKLSRPLCD